VAVTHTPGVTADAGTVATRLNMVDGVQMTVT
jgi:hypothetical protein